jgi:hypothetical protein
MRSPARLEERNFLAPSPVMLALRSQELSMTPAAFRKLALSLPETEERHHMDHPDFRVAGKIFATLGYPDKSRGMVKLSPEDQHYFSKDHPDIFIPVKGAWGRRGATSVHLKAATKDVLGKAIQAAWRNTAPKRLVSKV